MTMNFTTQGTDFSGAGQEAQATQPSTPNESSSSSMSDYSQEFQSNSQPQVQAPQQENQPPANQPNVQQEQTEQTNANSVNQPSNEDDAFGQYFNIQNPNLESFFQQPQMQPQFNQQYQQQQMQPQEQQPVQPNVQMQQNQQQSELFDDFSQIVEQAKTMENFDLGLTDEQLVDMLDKDPMGFANHIAKTTMLKTLEMVQKFDIGATIEQNSMNSIQKYAEQAKIEKDGQAFIEQSKQELNKQGIYLNDTQSDILFSTLAQQFTPSYQMYAQDFGNAYRAGTLNISKLPHNNGQMLTKQEYGTQSLIEMAKALTRGTQPQQQAPFRKVTTNQIYNNSNSAPVGQTPFDKMTDEEMIAYNKANGY